MKQIRTIRISRKIIMVWLLAGGGGVSEHGWADLLLFFHPFVCVCRLSGFIRSIVPQSHIPCPSPSSSSPFRHRRRRVAFGWNHKCYAIHNVVGGSVWQWLWMSIELVMLSTFTFTVIAIIIHVGSPVDTWHTHCERTTRMAQKKRLSNHEQAIFCSLLLRPFHWPCPISMTHEYIKLILLLTRNSTWDWPSS